MGEEWRSLDGVVEYGERYEVSNTGVVRRVDTKFVLKQGSDKDGYKKVTLQLNGGRRKYSVHRLVALSFIPTVSGKDVVHHKDGKKKNNAADNLEWVTVRENTIYAFRDNHEYRESVRIKTGEMGSKYGKKNGQYSNKKVVEYDLNGNVVNKFKSQKEASRQTGVNNTTICYQCVHEAFPRYRDTYFRFDETS